MLYSLQLITICSTVVTITFWMAGAIYFDVGRSKLFALPLMLLWLIAVTAGFICWQPLWQPFLILLITFFCFCIWWFSQKPSNNRLWDPNYVELARFEQIGNALTVYNVRNTDYRSLEDFTAIHETRRYHLSNLQGADAVIIYWGSSWMCHPMIIFDFGSEGRLCLSIEVRYRIDQEFGFWRSLYRQQELIYVASDERDSILKRSKYSENHDVYLYHLLTEKKELEKFFSEYVLNANNLVNNPHWYHGLTTNCTTSIYRQRGDKISWDWRWLFNGKLDKLLYDHERLDQSIPFTKLKNESWVNDIASSAPVDGFGNYIRNKLPTYSKEYLHGRQ